MLISLNWLKQHVQLPAKLDPNDLGLKMTMATVEIEDVLSQADAMQNIVVGEVLKVGKHPDADKLKLCLVDVGEEKPLSIICGGTNVKKGIKVVVAKIGARVRWHGEGDLVEIKKTKIRGVDSQGMICAGSEIGLSAMFTQFTETEIIDLTGNSAKVGTLVAEALGLNDYIFEVDNKSMTHRPDLWGHYGLAREIAAIYDTRLTDYNPPAIKPGKQNKLKIKIDDYDLCPRYMGVMMDNIKVEASPEWLQKRLLSVGLRPINNIVDITNYVMCDIGQPMHAFDLQKINGGYGGGTVEIIARRAENEEKIIALDETECELNQDMLVIADKGKAIAIAGVMGGDNTSVDEETTSIVLEAANFNATNVRRTATKLGIRTESSARFEKSLDPTLPELALRRAVDLVKEVCPKSQVTSNVADASKYSLSQGPIRLELAFLRKKLGMEIDAKQVKKILESLGFTINKRGDSMSVTVPTWRAGKDVSIPEDLVEEVARVYGYDNIQSVLPAFSVIPPQRNHLRELERAIKRLVSLEFGYTEVNNYSFVSDKWLAKLSMDTDKHIALDNPLSKDKPLLRRSLFANLMENVESLLHTNEQIRLFEVGKTFMSDFPGDAKDKNKEELLPRQDTYLGLVYADKKADTPFFELSGIVSGVSRCFGVKLKLSGAPVGDKFVHQGRTADILVGDEKAGKIFEFCPKIAKKLGMEARVAFAEINLNAILEKATEISEYIAPSQYPEVSRDIAFTVEKTVNHAQIEEVLLKTDPLLVRVELFDVYEGDNIQTGKKSLAYHLHYGTKTKTLKSTEVDKVHKLLEKTLADEFGAQIRK